MAVAVADDDEPASVDSFKWFVTVVDVPGRIRLPFIDELLAGITGTRTVTDGGGFPRLTRLPVGELYGAIFNLRASRRSFFCCITSFSWSSLFLVFKFSISCLRLMKDWLQPAQQVRAKPDDVEGSDAERFEFD